MNFWEEFTTARAEHLFPIFLLLAILFLSLIACVVDCRRERNLKDITLPPPAPSNIVVTDGKTGEQKEVAAQE
ncbi:unnamed protein product [Nippostrongylus brasiliensis]|uniref:Small integral membrane protein 29 n=1 Tax=Nippostrongylus brasiliensis TaxID=27835 RepID=A0A0N4YCP4_NIPBR|nr:unnamed protein product [Nippostrongylus brasiliensis]